MRGKKSNKDNLICKPLSCLKLATSYTNLSKTLKLSYSNLNLLDVKPEYFILELKYDIHNLISLIQNHNLPYSNPKSLILKP
jgi:hypothetical protein